MRFEEKESFYVAVTAVESWLGQLSQAYARDSTAAAPRVAAAGRQLAKWLRRIDRILNPQED